ncbi:uncharacterized protein [Engystomops pustulosus]|uniref:uncharacterized protein n=1 Tax=Engystomops pustulosus TaxID=76066 RepID=UPI003AFA6A6F
MKKTEVPTRRQENYYEEDTYVNVTRPDETKERDTYRNYKPKSSDSSFSFGELNAGFSDLADVNISSASTSSRLPDLEVVSSVKQQKVQRSMVMVLAVLMVIVFILLVVFIAITYPQYLTVSGEVADIQHNVSEFQKQAMEERDNLKIKMDDLSNALDLTVSGLVDDKRHNASKFMKNAMEEWDNMKTKMVDLSNLLDNICTVCPLGWHTLGSSCYYLSEEQRSWNSARDECYKVSSYLVMIKDRNESDSLNSLLTSNRRYWIGLRRDSKDIHIWKWLDGSEVTFTNWAVNEPNYHSSKEHCAESLSGPWNDLSCSEKLYYICEKNRFC